MSGGQSRTRRASVRRVRSSCHSESHRSLLLVTEAESQFRTMSFSVRCLYVEPRAAGCMRRERGLDGKLSRRSPTRDLAGFVKLRVGRRSSEGEVFRGCTSGEARRGRGDPLICG